MQYAVLKLSTPIKSFGLTLNSMKLGMSFVIRNMSKEIDKAFNLCFFQFSFFLWFFEMQQKNLYECERELRLFVPYYITTRYALYTKYGILWKQNKRSTDQEEHH